MNLQSNKQPLSGNSALELANRLYHYLDEKKGGDALLLDLNSTHSYFNYVLIVTATSLTHLKSLVKGVTSDFRSELPKTGSGLRSEDSESGWVIIDFIDVVVHIFLDEHRKFYNLERLWGDADVILQSSNRAATEESD